MSSTTVSRTPLTGSAAMARNADGIRRAGAMVGNLWLLGLVLVAWEVYGRASESLFVPPISRIMENFVDVWVSGPASRLFLSDLFWDHVTTSLQRFASGWGLAVLGGVVCGVVLGRSQAASRMYAPIVRFFAAIPNTLLLPVAVQIFGVTSGMNVFLIFLGSVWVVMINTADGVAGVDSMWLRSARSLRMSSVDLYRQVILPAAAPQILAGLRVSLGIGLILMVISEMFATTEGLGYQIVVAQTSFRYLDMWSAFALIGLIGIVLNLVFGTAEKRVLRWQRRTGLSGL